MVQSQKDKHHLRLAFAVPGVLYPEKAPDQVDHEHLTETFAVNTSSFLQAGTLLTQVTY